jgi:putative Ca2+/H+ antiporter (TMEM165/GDT1 family)
VNVGVLFIVLAVTAVAELPDKTMIATLVMGSRYRPVYVWSGAAGAFAVHVTLAVVAGRLLELVPHRPLEIVTTVLFAAGAVYLLAVSEDRQVEKGQREGDVEVVPPAPWRVVGSAFGIILLGEIGDLTQLLTIDFVARYHQPFAVGIGALAGLLGVSALGAFGGRALLRVIPVTVIRRIGGFALAGFTVYSIYALVSG